MKYRVAFLYSKLPFYIPNSLLQSVLKDSFICSACWLHCISCHSANIRLTACGQPSDGQSDVVHPPQKQHSGWHLIRPFGRHIMLLFSLGHPMPLSVLCK